MKDPNQVKDLYKMKHYNTEEVIPVKDFYQNIPGSGKVKELTKGKVYLAQTDLVSGIKYFYLKTDTGESKLYNKRSMFISKSNSRNNKLNKLGII